MVVNTWNNYFLPLIMLNSADKFPLTVGLALWQQTASADSGSQALFSTVITDSLVSILPLIAAFLLATRANSSTVTVPGISSRKAMLKKIRSCPTPSTRPDSINAVSTAAQSTM